MKYCNVKRCRFSNTHTTSFHKCGRCHQYGHGILECGNEAKIAELSRLTQFEIPCTEWCTSISCSNRYTHTLEAHNCIICGKRGACEEHDTSSLFMTCPFCKQEGYVDLKNEIFTGTECIICMENSKVVIFNNCKHALTCKLCVMRIFEGN